MIVVHVDGSTDSRGGSTSVRQSFDASSLTFVIVLALSLPSVIVAGVPSASLGGRREVFLSMPQEKGN
jgi:hypothetical protein